MSKATEGGARELSMRELVTWLFGFARPHWRVFIVVFALMGTYAAGNGFRIALLGLLFDGIIVPAEKDGRTSIFVRSYEALTPEAWHLPRVSETQAKVESVQLTADQLESAGIVDTVDSSEWVGVFRNGTISYRDRLGGQYTGPFNRLEVRRAEAPSESEFPEGGVPPDSPNDVRLDASAMSVRIQIGEVSDRGRAPFLIAFGIIGAILALVVSAANYGRLVLSQSINVRVIAKIREQIFGHLSKLSVDFFGGRHAGDLISRITNDVGSIQMALRYLFGELLQHPFTIVVSLGIAFMASWHLTVLLLPLLCLIVIPVLRSGRKVKKHGRGSMAKLGEVTEAMSQLLSGIRVVKAFGMESAQSQEFERRNAGFIRSNLKMVRAKATGRSVAECLYNLLGAVAMLVAAWLLIGEFIPLTFGQFSVFFGAISSLYQPLKSMSRAWNTVQESRAAAERVFEILDEQSSVADRDAARPMSSFERTIEFCDVSFRYGEDESWVLRHVSLTVGRGETIALVGKSGAGKSTLLDLLGRFYDPMEGAIEIDGRDLRDGTHASHLERIGIVGQDPFLFHTTIVDNIRFGDPSASEVEVREAAKAAAIHDEIEGMPEGYETVIGERGVKLSGGQRQRITIARAILKNAPILILDEATSALDSESERKVQAALENLMRGRTTFVIAHRLSTIKDADRIVVMESGQIVETGSHVDLVERGGHYARLQRMQDGLE